MGGEISSGLHQDARIEARASGTAPLLRIDLIKNNRVIESQWPARSNGNLVRVVWGDNIYQRRAATGLRTGELTTSQGSLRLHSKVNIDQGFEEVEPSARRISWRTAAVSNDRDGFLLDLSQITSGTLRFKQFDPDTFGLIDVEIPVGRLRAEGQFRHRVPAKVQHPYMKAMGVEPAFFLDLDMVDDNAPMDARFQFVDRTAPKPGDFYYLRVEQLDTNKAWSSPVWVN